MTTILSSLHEQDKYVALDHWFYTPQGKRVALAFSNELNAVEAFLNGKHLLQLGSCGENLWLKKLRFREKWLVSSTEKVHQAAFYSSITALSLERGSIDCVVAPLTMELFRHSKKPMNEIDRILKPSGYIIFFGVNPWSLWGLALQFGKVPYLDQASARPYSSFSLKYKLFNRGYRQCFLSSFYYIPPVKHEIIIHKMEFLNEMGKMLWPYPASFYCLIVQKYEAGLTSKQPQHSNLCLARA